MHFKKDSNLHLHKVTFYVVICLCIRRFHVTFNHSQPSLFFLFYFVLVILRLNTTPTVSISFVFKIQVHALFVNLYFSPHPNHK